MIKRNRIPRQIQVVLQVSHLKLAVQLKDLRTYREADIGSGDGLFSVQKPVTTKEDLGADDDFADFGGFEADQSISGEDVDFGAFKATDNLQNVSLGVFSDSSEAQLPASSS